MERLLKVMIVRNGDSLHTGGGGTIIVDISRYGIGIACMLALLFIISCLVEYQEGCYRGILANSIPHLAGWR